MKKETYYLGIDLEALEIEIFLNKKDSYGWPLIIELNRATPLSQYITVDIDE